MRRLSSAVAMILTMATGSARAADAVTPGFGAAVRLSYGVPIGKVTGVKGDDLSAVFSWGLPSRWISDIDSLRPFQRGSTVSSRSRPSPPRSRTSAPTSARAARAGWSAQAWRASTISCQRASSTPGSGSASATRGAGSAAKASPTARSVRPYRGSSSSMLRRRLANHAPPRRRPIRPGLVRAIFDSGGGADQRHPLLAGHRRQVGARVAPGRRPGHGQPVAA
jgi:hypothetical protein